MADTRPLLDYLMVAPPALPTQETAKTPNTTNDQYNWRQINSVSRWSEFTYAHIIQRYGTLLEQAQIASNVEPMPGSPAQPINTKRMFVVRFSTYIQSRLRRALRAGLQHLAPDQLADLGLTPITVDIGDAAQIVNGFKANIAFFQPGSAPNARPNHCPGVLRVSWKWGSDWAAAESEEDRRRL